MSTAGEVQDRIRITSAEAMSGRWVVPPVSYINPVRRHCLLTGRPIARGYWQVLVDGAEVVFTDRDHALNYTTFPHKFDKSLADANS